MTGELDRASHPPQPTANHTATRWGLTGTDNGSSFEYGGRLWFLFGNSAPTPTFEGESNLSNQPLRRPGDSDSMAYSTNTTIDGCVQLDFIPDALGAFTRPTVTTTAGQAPVTLRVNEIPIAGVSEGGAMYVVFGTDNFASNPPGQAGHPAGGPTRSVMTVADDGANTLGFRYLYDVSTRPDGKFTFMALADDGAGYVDFWGTDAGGVHYRHSAPYFARKRSDTISQAGGMQYFTGLDQDRRPTFSASESTAVPLFSDTPQNCAGELSAEWNTFIDRWIMLYNCADSTPANPRGIYMRVARQPWGPWSTPTTVFATQEGWCSFIHRAVTPAEPQCDTLSTPDRIGVQGGDYSPDIINRFTTGQPATPTTSASTTIYYTMSTWNPYQVVIMTTTVRS